MEELELKSVIKVCQPEELSAEEQHLVELAIEATQRSYAPYSHFHVGAAVRLENGVEIIGCNQENAAYPSGLCAERTALFSAGAQYPDVGALTGSCSMSPWDPVAVADRSSSSRRRAQAIPSVSCSTDGNACMSLRVSDS